MTKENPVEWFLGEVKTRDEPLLPVLSRWLCPVPGCDGEMKYLGIQWPTSDPGYHHQCIKCGVQLACKGGYYPRVDYRAAQT